MPYKERQIKKLYYSIGEVSKMLDIKASTIRSWEKDYKNIKPRKNRKGDRMFTEKDIYHLKVVKKLVDGDDSQTKKEVNSQIKENKTQIDNTFSAIQRLEKLKFEMLKLKEQLLLEKKSNTKTS